MLQRVMEIEILRFIDILTSDALDMNIDSLFPNLLDCKNGQSVSRIMTRNVADFASKIIESTEKISPAQLIIPSNEVVNLSCLLMKLKC